MDDAVLTSPEVYQGPGIYQPGTLDGLRGAVARQKWPGKIIFLFVVAASSGLWAAIITTGWFLVS